ncbi:hypothetical protein C8J56DRAFT_881082 [Mycena floridula]|nr:hypothetical protein C8J56DRAFT_881082 [Mycena floridula]
MTLEARPRALLLECLTVMTKALHQHSRFNFRFSPISCEKWSDDGVISECFSHDRKALQKECSGPCPQCPGYITASGRVMDDVGICELEFQSSGHHSLSFEDLFEHTKIVLAPNAINTTAGNVYLG